MNRGQSVGFLWLALEEVHWSDWYDMCCGYSCTPELILIGFVDHWPFSIVPQSGQYFHMTSTLDHDKVSQSLIISIKCAEDIHNPQRMGHSVFGDPPDLSEICTQENIKGQIDLTPLLYKLQWWFQTQKSNRF